MLNFKRELLLGQRAGLVGDWSGRLFPQGPCRASTLKDGKGSRSLRAYTPSLSLALWDSSIESLKAPWASQDIPAPRLEEPQSSNQVSFSEQKPPFATLPHGPRFHHCHYFSSFSGWYVPQLFQCSFRHLNLFCDTVDQGINLWSLLKYP